MRDLYQRLLVDAGCICSKLQIEAFSSPQESLNSLARLPDGRSPTMGDVERCGAQPHKSVPLPVL
jgi:hypothetical protein